MQSRVQCRCGVRLKFGRVLFQPWFLTWWIMDCIGVDKVGTHSKTYFIAMLGCRLHVMWVDVLSWFEVVEIFHVSCIGLKQASL